VSRSPEEVITRPSSEVTVDLPDVVRELTEAFHRYEAALVRNDLPLLAELFWDDDATVRYGVADAQMGAAALRQWRAEQAPLPAGRELLDTRVTTFDASCATVTTCFRYPGRAMIGRQSQMWIRFAAGWRIVSAHVSEIAVREERDR
jgi:hypothetical protein